MKDKKPFFIRQHIKMSGTAYPTNDPNMIRIKFLEKPYRIWRKLNRTHRAIFVALSFTFIIPFTIYKSTLKLIANEYKSRAQAEIGENVFEMKEILESSTKNQTIDKIDKKFKSI